jgi:hypothetical protein
VTQRLTGNQNQMDTQPGGQLANQNLQEQNHGYEQNPDEK